MVFIPKQWYLSETVVISRNGGSLLGEKGLLPEIHCFVINGDVENVNSGPGLGGESEKSVSFGNSVLSLLIIYGYFRKCRSP